MHLPVHGVAVGVGVGVAVGVGVGAGAPTQYFPPVFNKSPEFPVPPHTIISLLVPTAVCWARASGALVVLIGVQPSVAGSYRPPVLTTLVPSFPPHTTIMSPVKTVV